MNLHFHGCEFDPKIEDVRSALDGGETKTYEFQVADDHPPGFNWYHNHVKGTAGFSSLSGLNGIVIIEDTGSDITEVPEIAEATEVFLLLAEAKFNETTGEPADWIDDAFDFDWTPVTNGQVNPSYTFQQGETVLFRAVSASMEAAYYLSVNYEALNGTAVPLIPVARDGYPVPELVEETSITIDAGSRAEFMMQFDTPGTYLMRRGPWNMGITGAAACLAAYGDLVPNCKSYDFEKVFATFIVETTVIEPARSYPPQTVPPTAPLLQKRLTKSSTSSKKIMFTMTESFPIFQIPNDGPFAPPGVGFGLNGVLTTPFHFHDTVTAGTCESWFVSSHHPHGHTFHVHGHPFQVLAVDGVDAPTPYFRDTMPIKINATVQMCFDKFDSGALLVHCHMPIHQDIGMGGFYAIEQAPVDSPAPDAPVTTDTPTDTSSVSGTMIFWFVPVGTVLSLVLLV
jgi:FtsP/CotA-like multicopper oxidase with cupredoxin domain